MVASENVRSGTDFGSTRLKKAGGSLLVTVPAAARHMLNLKEGQELTVTVEGTRITLEPVAERTRQRVRKPRYSLDELLTQGDAQSAVSEDENDWQNSPAVGREVW